jgi:hypothetical protein
MNVRRSSASKKGSPGPGAYFPTTTETSGKFSFSKSNHLKVRFSDRPGPGSYELSGTLKSGPIMGKSVRPPLSQIIDTPGPGTYDG